MSFDALRLLAHRLPGVLLASWVRTPSQPIAIDDALAYVLAARDAPLPASDVVEIGGADRVAYVEIMEEIARRSGKTRVRPDAAAAPSGRAALRGARPERLRILGRLVESLRHDTTVQDGGRAIELLGSVRPRGLREAVAAALA